MQTAPSLSQEEETLAPPQGYSSYLLILEVSLTILEGTNHSKASLEAFTFIA